MSGEPPDEAGSRRGPLIGLVVIVLIVACVVFIMGRLRGSAELQDCVASGRTNCAPIAASSAGR